MHTSVRHDAAHSGRGVPLYTRLGNAWFPDAALLHDAVEDQGGAPILSDIRKRFGDHVANIVDACSDTDQVPKPPWRERKQQYLDHLEDTTASALRVSLADKLHNARSILRDLHVHGPALWSRFNAGLDDQLWYYGELAQVFSRRVPGVYSDELVAIVDEIEAVASDN